MTSNQIAYWNMRETRRSNLANEKLKESTLGETKRANIAKESLDRDKLNLDAEYKRQSLILGGIDTGLRAASSVIQGASSVAKLLMGGR